MVNEENEAEVVLAEARRRAVRMLAESPLSDTTEIVEEIDGAEDVEEVVEDVGEPEGSSPDDEPATEESAVEEEAPEESTEEESQQEVPESEDAEDGDDHFWNQYKTDEARKKAFRDNKEYAAKMAKEARELKAEIEKLRVVQPKPEEPEKPTLTDEQRLDQTFKHLHETDQVFQEQVAGLRNLVTYIDSKQTELTGLDKDLAETAKFVDKTSAALEHLRDWATACQAAWFNLSMSKAGWQPAVLRTGMSALPGW